MKWSGRGVDPHGDTAHTPSGPVTRASTSSAFEPSELVGRYEIRERLGEGGMAVVYSARDPQLGRNVAIKVLHSEMSQHMDRLLREAQAMAQLSHPNVVTVYEVGVHQGRIFMCLELVDGSNLREWLAAAPRTQKEILATFIAAGRGLETAHATRIVHRDFKPDNVLIDASGRARVTDFGIARHMSESATPAAIDHTATLTDLRTPVPLTATGALLGTPNYMAPELFDGGVADTRSDQYAYSVALYEAIYGALPFSATPLPMLIEKVHAGARDPVPATRKVPRWLRAVILRGMSRDRADRFPSMSELLAELERDRGAMIRRGAIGGLGVVAVGLAATVWLRGGEEPRAMCGTSGRLEGVWDATRRARVEQAFRGTGLPHAESSFKTAVAQLDAYAGAWSAMDREVCEASVVRKEQSGKLGELRSLCLEKRRAELSLAVGMLEQPDAQTVARAGDVIGSLSSVAPCASATELLEVVPPPADPKGKATIEQVQTMLSEANLQLELAKFDKAGAALERAQKTLGALDYAPLRAQLLDLQGALDLKQGAFAGAERHFLDAVAAADRGRDDRRKVKVLTELAHLSAWEFEDPRRAEPYLALAGSGIARIGGDNELSANLLASKATAAYVRGDFQQSLEHSEKSRELLELLHGTSHPLVARALNYAALQLTRLSRPERAAAYHARALAIVAAAYGETHPDYAELLNDRATGLVEAGKLDEAEADLRRALTIIETVYGKRHPDTAMALSNLGSVLYAHGQIQDAAAKFQAALAIEDEVIGPNHVSVASTLMNLGAAQSALGDTTAAEANLRRALAIREKHFAGNDPRVAEVQATLGSTLVEVGRYADARPLLEGAVERLASARAGSSQLADAQFALAGCLWELKVDRARARSLAAAAEASLATSDPDGLTSAATDGCQNMCWQLSSPPVMTTASARR